MESTFRPKRRQSSHCGDELFEFVDYTSVSDFERLITAIEEILHSWGTKDGSYGVFSYDKLQHASHALHNSSSEEYTRYELLSIGQDTYTLTYYCHPHALRRSVDKKHPLAAADFYQLKHDGGGASKAFHPLHRWTGLDRLFVLAPEVDSFKAKFFSAVDIHQAKTLLSACAIALDNTKCSVPIFVPVGSSRHNAFIGYLLDPTIQDGDDRLNEIEVRFNTSVYHSVPTVHTRLEGLKDIFMRKIEAAYEEYGAVIDIEQDESLLAGAVFAYSLKNLHDGKWFNQEDDDDGEERRLPPQLKFGSYNDPLRALTLEAIFPLAPVNGYTDNTMTSNMDAFTASEWRLNAEFAPSSQQRAYLSTLIERVVTSWVRDPRNRDYLPPYDDSNQVEEEREKDKGVMRNIFYAVGSNRNSPASHQSKVSALENVPKIVDALFTAHHIKQSSEKTLNGLDDKVKLHSVDGLAIRLKHGTAVPQGSFLWNFTLYALDGLNEVPESQIGSMEFLKAVWMETVRRIRWCWENFQLIPDVSVILPKQDQESADDDTEAAGIDLRYSLLHQKLTMVNYCIQRRLLRGEKAPSENEGSSKSRQHLSGLFDDLSSSQELSRDGSKLDKFSSFLEKLIDGDEPLFEPTDKSLDTEESFTYAKGQEEEDDDDDDDVFFDSVEDIASDRHAQQRTSSNSSIAKKQSTPSRSSSISTFSEAQPPNSMSESFVRLNHASSVESLSAKQVAEKDVNIPEISDPEASEGRKYQHPSLLLLQTKQPMWIPETQDAGFMTEDMVKQQANVFESLGTSDDAAHLRAKLQSAQLFSDMEAFKAANPHAKLEDFVRWHSPRDWISTAEEEEGYLSARMSEPNNIWQELWKCARRIPVSRQKPLFDARAEGEKALHYLETLSVHEAFGMLLPTVALIAYDTFLSQPISVQVKHVAHELSRLGEMIMEFPWDLLRVGKCSMNPVISAIRERESLICNGLSLANKLPEQRELINKILMSSEAVVEEGDERAAVCSLFQANDGIIPDPVQREYVLYSNCEGILTNQNLLPMRQYAFVKNNELRLIDMQCTDTRNH